jgi:hypothetical protein
VSVRPFHAVLLAFAVALLADAYIFRAYHDLSRVAAYTVFINCFAVLTMVPLYLVARLRSGELEAQMPSRVKSAMKAVSAFALLTAIATFILFDRFGGYLIQERLDLLRAMLEASDLPADEQQMRYQSAERIYSPGIQVLFGTIAVMMTGFISSIIGAIAITQRR